MDPEQGVREQKNKICNQIFKVNTGTTHPGKLLICISKQNRDHFLVFCSLVNK